MNSSESRPPCFHMWMSLPSMLHLPCAETLQKQTTPFAFKTHKQCLTPLSPPRQFLVFGNYKNNHFKCNNVGHTWLGCIFSAIFACKVDHKASHTISFIFFLSVAVCSIPWGHNATQLLQHILFDIDVQLGWEMIMRSWFCSRQNMSKMGFAILLESVRSFAAFAFSRLFSHVRLSCFSSSFFFLFSGVFVRHQVHHRGRHTHTQISCTVGLDAAPCQAYWFASSLFDGFERKWQKSGKIDPWTGATEKWSGEHRGQQLLFGFCLFWIDIYISQKNGPNAVSEEKLSRS